MSSILLALAIFGLVVLIITTYEVITNNTDLDKPPDAPKEEQKETLD